MDIELLQGKIIREVDRYNALLKQEADLLAQVEAVREQRTIALGRVQGLQEMVSEVTLADESMALSAASNGSPPEPA